MSPNNKNKPHILNIEFLINSILSILFLFIFLVFIIVFITPFYIYRQILNVFIVITHYKGLQKIVSISSSRFLVNGPNIIPNTWTVVLSFKVRGNLDVNKLKQLINERILEVKRSNSNEYLYSELRQYIVWWMSYSFFKNVDNFSIDNYVSLYGTGNDNESSHSLITDDYCYNKIEHEFQRKPWKDKQSPWEVLLVKNVENDESEINNHAKSSSSSSSSVILVRFQHVIADGVSVYYGILKLMDHKVISYMDRIVESKRSEGLATIGMKLFLKAPFIGSYYFIKLLRSLWENTDADWINIAKDDRNLNPKELPPIVKAKSKRIPISKIKTICNNSEVSFTAVVMAALGGGLRKFLIEECHCDKIPKFVKCGIPVPGLATGRSAGFGNNFFPCLLIWPTGLPTAKERLTFCNDFMKQQKAIGIPNGMMIHWITSLKTYLPASWNSKPSASLFPVLSIFPGPEASCKFMDTEVTSLYHNGETASICPFCLRIFTYNGKLQIHLTTRKTSRFFNTQESVNKLMKVIEEEFDILAEIQTP